ncbi:MAG TPA: glycosyltransferase family 39 protein [Candidatus Latescibacteria bacterium]|jgi:predicted membrane-bound mannosyltransferase|nr:glycosyltransferase family 39 protein [Candidatus Latescibacterota bacterium]HJP32793.1 glycosyltransferase family 39 protein [Candidatus Latescibacterota bacterium]
MTVLVVACLLAAGLRFYQLGHVPNGFTADEAAHGYNAYSLLVTGADAFGRRLPLYVDNFGDSIEATYIYLIVPVVAALGLTEFAVRLPAAILGLLAVPAIYLVGRQLYGSTVAGIASLLIAASPWAVQVSRYASRAAFVPLIAVSGRAGAAARASSAASPAPCSPDDTVPVCTPIPVSG